jgi:hypothetical protein
MWSRESLREGTGASRLLSLKEKILSSKKQKSSYANLEVLAGWNEQSYLLTNAWILLLDQLLLWSAYGLFHGTSSLTNAVQCIQSSLRQLTFSPTTEICCLLEQFIRLIVLLGRRKKKKGYCWKTEECEEEGQWQWSRGGGVGEVRRYGWGTSLGIIEYILQSFGGVCSDLGCVYI